MDDVYASSGFEWAVSVGHLVAAGCCGHCVWGRGLFEPCLGDEHYVWIGGGDGVPDFVGVLTKGSDFQQHALELVLGFGGGRGLWSGGCHVAGEVAVVAGKGSFHVPR